MHIKPKYLLILTLLFSILYTAANYSIQHYSKKTEFHKKSQVTHSDNETEEGPENNGNDRDPLFSFTHEKVSYIPDDNQLVHSILEKTFLLFIHYSEILKPPPEHND